MRALVIFLSVLPALAPILASPSVARAEIQPDWYSSLVSDRGLEIDADVRLFTLFAALNSLGYDDGPLARKDPIPRPALSAARLLVRTRAPVPPALAARFQAFFDAHPAPLRAYVAFVTSLGAPPEFAPGSPPAEAASLKGFEALLAEYYRTTGVAAAHAELLPQYRTAIAGSLTSMDAAFASADRLLASARGEQPAPPVIALDLLAAPGSGYGLRQGGGTLISVGPGPSGDRPDVERAIELYAQVRAGAMIEERAAAVRGLPDLLAKVRRAHLAAGDLAPGEYLSSCFSFALAASAIPEERAAELDRADANGCWISRDLEKVLSETASSPSASPLDALLTEGLSALDLRRVGPGPDQAEGR